MHHNVSYVVSFSSEVLVQSKTKDVWSSPFESWVRYVLYMLPVKSLCLRSTFAKNAVYSFLTNVLFKFI